MLPGFIWEGLLPTLQQNLRLLCPLGQGSKGGYSQDFSFAWEQCLEAPSWHIGLCFSFQAAWLEK